VVSRRQLLEGGVGRRAIEHRLARRRLHPLHRGVYAVGHRLVTVEGRWMAAVLAAGPGAVLSHPSAASLWKVLRNAGGLIHVTAPRPMRSRRGLRVHRSVLPVDELTETEGIPVTSIARTLIDLAAVLDRPRVERAINEAEVLRLSDSPSLAELLERYPRRPGTRALREILAAGRWGMGPTRSELEDRFLAFVAEKGLPRPETNVWLATAQDGFEVDCVWHRAGLIVELDGRAVHDTNRAFERDRARDRALSAAGWRE
jgi:hypothetical protein